MPKELAKQYAPQGTEDRIYQNWCDKGYFHTQIDRSKKPFTIVMPPPNVTGQLHMGHAMDETWQPTTIFKWPWETVWVAPLLLTWMNSVVTSNISPYKPTAL